MTAAITGSKAISIVKKASTWGTAVQGATGNKFAAEYSPSISADELRARTIGSGAYFQTDATKGNVIPSVGLVADLGYRNGCDTLIAALLGTDTVSSELTASQSDYRHRITFNTSGGSYVTYAIEAASDKVFEYPTCVVTSCSIKPQSVPGYLDASFNLLANDLELATAVNTNANLASATYTETTPELVRCALDSTYQMNSQSGGGVSSGDQYNIVDFTFNIERPHEIVPEIKGSAGNSAPRASGLPTSNIQLVVKELADLTYYTVWEAETAKKAAVTVLGTQIGSGSYKTFSIYMPRMILLQAPDYQMTDEGINQLTLEFQCFKATSNPTSMNSTYPYFEFINGLSTGLLA